MDTIVAISTAPGLGAIGIVRLSGQDSLAIALGIFQPAKPSPNGLSPRLATHGSIRDEDGALDEALAVFFPAPDSYTGEEVVELHCHGSPLLLERMVALLVDHGARPAEPGEFTKRAFLNGRLDMTQAEAVDGLIRARSEAALRAAVRQLQGGMRRQLEPLREKLLGLRTRIEASLDFPEEVGEAEDSGAVIEEVLERARQLASTYRAGRLLREGAKLVIAGKVNVGKSTLLNALLRQQRAIVSEKPGTTRDYVQEMLDLEGSPVVVVDTAGIRPPEGEVEAEGVLRSKGLIEEADLLLAVLDSSQPPDEDDHRVLDLTAGRERVIILNKWDLPGKLLHPDDCTMWNGSPAMAVSARDGRGMERLRQVLAEAVRSQTDALAEGVAANLRHYGLLKAVEGALERAKGSVGEGHPLDQIASDLREASERLGEITGETFTEEIVQRIFSTFCIGK